MPEKVSFHEFLEIYSRKIFKIGVPVILTLILDAIFTRILEEKSGSANLDRSFTRVMVTSESSIDLKWSLIFAAIFIALLIVITTVILCCYYFGCTKFVYGWLGLAVVLLLSFYIYTTFGKIPSIFNIPVDWITAAFLVLNLVVVGCMSIFWRAPPIVTQAFLVLISIATALVFLSLPDWTVWILLVLLIIYDACMVLCPGGCLNLLVKKSEERGDAIPGLLYTAAAFIWKSGGRENDSCSGSGSCSCSDSDLGSGSGSGDETPLNNPYCNNEENNDNVINEEEEEANEGKPLVEIPEKDKEAEHEKENENEEVLVKSSSKSTLKYKIEGKNAKIHAASSSEEEHEVEEKQKKENKHTKSRRKKNGKKRVRKAKEAGDSDEEEEDESVKLGIGDFVFYGILVTRAARIGWDITVLTMLAVLLGLSLTLVCLVIFERPLPALPFSLFLGIIFYVTGAMTFRPFSNNTRSNTLVF